MVEEWNEEVSIPFAIVDLNGAVKKRDVGIVSVLVHFLRVIILNGEYQKKIHINKDDYQWKDLI